MKIGVIGSGTMGHGIAQVAAMSTNEVIIYDINKEIVENGIKKIKWSLDKLSEKKNISKEKANQFYNNIKGTVRIEDLSDCEYIFEAVSEDLEIKKSVYKKLENNIKDDAIIASNTSTLPITELAKNIKLTSRFIGTHFFNPPVLMPLVEIIKGEFTSEKTLEITIDLIKKFKKEIAICKKDVPGFIVNRIIGPLLQEAGWMLERKEASIIEIDSAAKYEVGLPMGLFELADYTGIDIIYKAGIEISKRDKSNVPIAPIFKKYFEEKNYGQKTSSGFYKYETKKYERPDIPKNLSKNVDYIELFAPAINAAAWLLRENVSTKEDIERAVKLGLGFPEGLLKLADKWGIKKIVDVLNKKKINNKNESYYEPDPLLKEMLDSNRLGMETDSGFFEYDSTKKEYEEILTIKKYPIAWLIINRPHRLNALTTKTIEEMELALDDLRTDNNIRALILKGEGEKAFSVGADVTAFTGLNSKTSVEVAKRFHRVFDKLERFPMPTIAAIDGYALGGGCEVTLACDFRIATEKSVIGQTEIKLGLIPGAGGTQRLPKLIGETKAKELIYFGERVSATECEKIGLVSKVLEQDKFIQFVEEFATKLAELPPLGLKYAKDAIYKSRKENKEGYLFEAESFGSLMLTKDFMEGITAFFSKRKPEFKGE